MPNQFSGTPQERFDEKWMPIPESGCWLWTAFIHRDGYGLFRYKGRIQRAHRVSYMINVAPIPAGMHVCHTCDVTSCVNPSHLFLGTHQDNMTDMHNKDRHPLKTLSDDDVRAIRADPRLHRVIAAEYGVGRQHISRIINHIQRRNDK